MESRPLLERLTGEFLQNLFGDLVAAGDCRVDFCHQNDGGNKEKKELKIGHVPDYSKLINTCQVNLDSKN